MNPLAVARFKLMLALVGCLLGVSIIAGGAWYYLVHAGKEDFPGVTGAVPAFIGTIFLLINLKRPLYLLFTRTLWVEGDEGLPPDPFPPWLAHVLTPFPRAEGFSAYRFPGIIVHLPTALSLYLVVAAVLLGPATPPLAGDSLLDPLTLLSVDRPDAPGVFHLLAGLPLLAVIALLLGRDLAIFCHYFPPLTFGLMALFFFLPPYMDPFFAQLSELRRPLAEAMGAGFFPYLWEAVLLLLFAVYLRRMTRESA
ncbi:MAG: hypothetical protein HQL51_14580 [Magnetococcales bacterium]|nr:hypothetical protein [Magnetococcales bacterium]